MPKGYVVVNVTVTDAARYPEYAKRAAETVHRFGGRYLVRGGRPEVCEGTPRIERLVILEFPSIDEARRWYESSKYALVKELRLASARADLFLIEGSAES